MLNLNLELGYLTLQINQHLSRGYPDQLIMLPTPIESSDTYCFDISGQVETYVY